MDGMKLKLEASSSSVGGPFLCITLVLASVILFSWRVYIIVSTRLAKEERIRLQRLNKEGCTIEHAKGNDIKGSVEKEDIAEKKLGVIQEENTKCVSAEENTPGVTQPAPQPQSDSATGTTNSQDNEHTVTQRGIKTPLDILDEMVSDEEIVAEEEMPGQNKAPVHRGSFAQSPGVRLTSSRSMESNDEETTIKCTVTPPVSSPLPESNTFVSSALESNVPGPSMPSSESVKTPVRKLSQPRLETGEPQDEVLAQASPVDPLTKDSDCERETSDDDAEEEQQRSDVNAERLKLIGNQKYTNGEYDEALEYYGKAIDACPRASKTLAAILFCNMAAVHTKRESWDDCIQCCTDSIELHPEFAKAYIRRYIAYEAKEKYNEAKEDLKKAAELDPSLSIKYAREIAILEKKAAEQFEKEKAEMVSKLKEFGGWALGKIGMSIDDFKVIQDPATGGYNIQYQPSAQGTPAAEPEPS